MASNHVPEDKTPHFFGAFNEEGGYSSSSQVMSPNETQPQSSNENSCGKRMTREMRRQKHEAASLHSYS